ncbi:hypothetical protein PR729_04790 [Providencia rettgeri]|nr:hypothetical protein PR729_04790 [Providencia rettgeri]
MIVAGAWIILVQAFVRAKKTKAPNLDVNLNPRQFPNLNNLILSPFRKGVKRNGQNCPSGASYRVPYGVVFFVIDARKAVLFQYQ